MSPARVVLAAGLVVLAQVLDAALLSRWGLSGATVDLTLVVVAALALVGGPWQGAAVGVAAGLAADLTPPSAPLLGVGALAYGLAGAAAGRWHRPGERSVLLPAVAVVAATLTFGVVRAVSAVLAGGSSPGAVLGLLPSAVGYQLVAAAVLLPAVVLADRVVEGDRAETVRL